MSSSSDMGPAASAGPGGLGSEPNPSSPANWREALMGLIAARVALIQLESKEAARGGARCAIFFLVAVGCVFFGWILLLAGGVSLLATATGWPWSWVALGFAAIHLLLALIFANLAKPSENPAFPVTRAEFQKDREWIENFNTNRKSND